MEKEEAKKRKRKGLIVTATTHVIVITLFCLFGFDIIEPKPGDIEVEWVMEGAEDAGGKTEEEMTAQKVADEAKTTTKSQSDASAQQDEQLLTDESSEVDIKSTPVVKPKKEVKDVTLKDTKEKDPEESKTPKKEGISDLMKQLDQQTAQKQGEDTKGSNGKGPGENPGTQGKPGGTGKSPKGGNPGGGDGRWVVAGRVPLKIDQKQNDCNATGIVKVYIKIDRLGNVISAVSRGGTTTSQCLVNKAIEQAKAIKYAKSDSYNEGIITIDLGL